MRWFLRPLPNPNIVKFHYYSGRQMLDDYRKHQLVKAALILQQKEFTQIKILALALKQEPPREGHGHAGTRAFGQCGGEVLGKILSISEVGTNIPELPRGSSRL